jgi:hypothetical protein
MRTKQGSSCGIDQEVELSEMVGCTDVVESLGEMCNDQDGVFPIGLDDIPETSDDSNPTVDELFDAFKKNLRQKSRREERRILLLGWFVFIHESSFTSLRADEIAFVLSAGVSLQNLKGKVTVCAKEDSDEDRLLQLLKLRRKDRLLLQIRAIFIKASKCTMCCSLLGWRPVEDEITDAETRLVACDQG